MLAFIQVALHKTHQGKPFWLSRDEIDIGLYAEALAAVFRFLPEEESLPLFIACLEPERSEAVKIVAARAGSMLALEVGRLCLIL
jgi:neurofibromin 1